jgi:hypothetical protein
MFAGAICGAWADQTYGSDRSYRAVFGGAVGGFLGTILYFQFHPRPIGPTFLAWEFAIIGAVTGWILRCCLRRVANRR